MLICLGWILDFAGFDVFSCFVFRGAFGGFDVGFCCFWVARSGGFWLGLVFAFVVSCGLAKFDVSAGFLLSRVSGVLLSLLLYFASGCVLGLLTLTVWVVRWFGSYI